MMEPEDSPSSAVSSETLLLIAEELKVKPRLLEEARAQGLLPRATHRGPNNGVRPTWLYPARSDEQLRRLIAWREHTVDPTILLILLWLDGYDVPTADVKIAVLAGLEAVEEQIRKSLAKELAGSDSTVEGERLAFSHIGGAMARKKDKTSPFPRKKGVSSQERADAFSGLIGLLLSASPEPLTEDQAMAIERVTGLDQGRQPFMEDAPRITRPSNELFPVPDMNLSMLRAWLADAPVALFDAARRLTGIVLLRMPVMVNMLRALTGEENPGGFGPLALLGDAPDLVLILLPTMIRAYAEGPRPDLDELYATLDEATNAPNALDAVLAMPQAELAANLEGKPAQAEATARMINAHLDGQFTPAPERTPARKPPRRRA